MSIQGPPSNVKELKASAASFIREHNLEDFFPGDPNNFLETLVNKVVELQKDKTTPLGRVGKTKDLVKLGMYQPVIYCGQYNPLLPTAVASGAWLTSCHWLTIR